MPAEAQRVEAAGVVAALAVLVQGQGAMLAPYLERLLALVLDPRVLACPAPSVGPAAHRLAGTLATSLPARLLLPALESTFRSALLVRLPPYLCRSAFSPTRARPL